MADITTPSAPDTQSQTSLQPSLQTPTLKPIHSIILDANAILTNNPPISTLLTQSERLYTTSAVINEIRDETARLRFQTQLQPFLEPLRSVRPASITLISDFARRTGDLEVLSRPDIEILALTYELECERNEGDWRLRKMPGQKGVNGAVPEGLAERRRAKDAKEREERDGGENAITKDEPRTATESGPEVIKQNPSPEASTTEESISKILESTTLDLSETDPTSSTQQNTTPNDMEDDQEDDSDSDGGDWITPSNLSKHIAAEDSNSTPTQTQKTTPTQLQVALITADYAMQNVALRLNLNLLSPSASLLPIKSLRTYILRCHACFATTKVMSKQFCPKCGGATLLRTSCSTDQKTGEFKIHLKKNMQWNNRGNVFSIPKPVAGSSNGKRSIGGGQGGWGRGLILAEDQPEYLKAKVEDERRAKREKDLMDDDFLPGLYSGVRREGGGGRIKVGGGRNVNSKKRH